MPADRAAPPSGEPRAAAAIKRAFGDRLEAGGELERRLPAGYRDHMEHALDRLRPSADAVVLALAEAPDLVRGYEHMKLASVAGYQKRVAELLGRLDDPAHDS